MPSPPGNRADPLRYSAPALDKGLDVLEILSRQESSLTFSEIAAALGRSKSELYRVVQNLEAREYIARAGDGYELTNRLFALGLARPRIRTLTEAAALPMRRLVEAIDQSCHLVVLSGEEIVVIHRLEAQGELGFSVRVGYRRRASDSTSGLLLEAFSQPHPRSPQMTRIRAEGHALRPSRSVTGVTDIAAPVFARGEAVATITVPYVHRTPVRMTLEAVVKAVQTAAAEASSELDAPA